MSNRQITILTAFPFEERERIVRALLYDRTTRKNILWGTDGSGHTKTDEMQLESVYSDGELLIQPRAEKAKEQQSERTKSKAEVFTPSWICCFMNDALDEDWFGRKDIFYHIDGAEWFSTNAPISFPEKRTWKQYVDSRRLEITCGEAPFLVSPYDAADGSPIPIDRRIGLLDRKLRVINENASGESEWVQQTIRAYQSVYGYEYQGDSLLIARLNLLKTFVDYCDAKWNRMPDKEELREILKIISWNLWQMDGLTDKVPFNDQMKESISLFDFDVTENDIQHCKIYDWRRDNALKFFKLKNTKERSTKDRKEVRNMKFDYIIGNPPYQEQTDSKSSRMLPLYDKFMEETYKCGKKVELVTPARFLFNAGFTSKEWNNLRLNDEHFKVLFYEADSSKVFSNVDLKGGVAVTYRDEDKSFGAIKMFIPSEKLNSIVDKVVKHNPKFVGLNTIICPRDLLHYSEKFFVDHPDFKEMNNNNNVVNTNAFDKFPAVFFNDAFTDSIPVFGRSNKGRETRYIKSEYLDVNDFIDVYKLIIPEVNGSGKFGETMAPSVFGNKGVAFTDTFICIGKFSSEFEVNTTAKYIQTKFVRTMLGILKKTQHNTADKWSYVPLQDFTANSDINWSAPIKAIDQQLYKKYKLTDEEIAFIESHVKEMV